MTDTTRSNIGVRKGKHKPAVQLPRIKSGKVTMGSDFIGTGLIFAGGGAQAPAHTGQRAPKKHLHYRALFESSPGFRVEVVKTGVSPRVFQTLAHDMNVDQNAVFQLLGVPRATVNRKLKAGKPLDVSSSERALGLVRLVGQVKQMVEESGNADGFDAPTWVGQWLDRPLPALGGKTPGEFMDTTPGQELVSHLLAQAQSGAYA
ncbi:MAG: antitoxin Xre/MbcA/ParS toxin-binding domain-containing protein [Elusimicrobiota bacterium]